MMNIDDKDKIKDIYIIYDKNLSPGSQTWFLSELQGHRELMAGGTESFCWCSSCHKIFLALNGFSPQYIESWYG